MSILKSAPSSRGSSKQWRSRNDARVRGAVKHMSHLWWCNKKLKACLFILSSAPSSNVISSFYKLPARVWVGGVWSQVSVIVQTFEVEPFSVCEASHLQREWETGHLQPFTKTVTTLTGQKQRQQTDLTGISGEISFLYYLLKGLIWVRTHVHVKRKDSH